MNKEQALLRLTNLEKEASELRKIIESPDDKIGAAKIWLEEFLKVPFEVKITPGHITYNRDGKWIFQQDLKNGRLWCYYYKVWQVFETEFGMKYEQIQALHKDVVGIALNCKELTPMPVVVPVAVLWWE